jgi:DnaJ-class molecular chaperone
MTIKLCKICLVRLVVAPAKRCDYCGMKRRNARERLLRQKRVRTCADCGGPITDRYARHCLPCQIKRFSASVERQRDRQASRMKKLRLDPTYVAKEKIRQRERLSNSRAARRIAGCCPGCGGKPKSGNLYCSKCSGGGRYKKVVHSKKARKMERAWKKRRAKLQARAGHAANTSRAVARA